MSPSLAPPPFQPQRVEGTLGEPDGYIAVVTTPALGITGVGVTVTRAEGRSYWVRDSAGNPKFGPRPAEVQDELRVRSRIPQGFGHVLVGLRVGALYGCLWRVAARQRADRAPGSPDVG